MLRSYPHTANNRLDVTGDKVLTPLDVLILVKYLNSNLLGGRNFVGTSATTIVRFKISCPEDNAVFCRS